jgi:glycosyltransferase involved in cell wall biosynthesis
MGEQGVKPLVSILIPAFNAEKWIADTIRSAMEQTWERKEIIVVDDGSTDQTVAVARRFEPDSVRVVTQRNQGAAAARNRAFSLSQGDYIQWLDADDLLSPNKIAAQLALLDGCYGGRTLLSSAYGQFMHRPYRATFVPTALWCDLSPVEWLLRKMGQNLFMQTSTWLVSRELTEAAGPWNTSLLVDDDGEYFCRILMESRGVRFVPDAKVYYRVSGSGTLSHVGFSVKKVEAHWRSMRLHIGYLRSLEDTGRVHAACLNYLQTSFIYFYPEHPEIVREAEETARELGGELVPSPMSWKYSWIEKAFGYTAAKRARFQLPQVKQSLVRTWDELLFRIEDRRRPASP